MASEALWSLPAAPGLNQDDTVSGAVEVMKKGLVPPLARTKGAKLHDRIAAGTYPLQIWNG